MRMGPGGFEERWTEALVAQSQELRNWHFIMAMLYRAWQRRDITATIANWE